MIGAEVPQRGARPILLGAVALALLLSAAAIWFLTGELVAAAAFTGGLIVLLGTLWLLSRSGQNSDADVLAPPDWSVTVAALENDPAGGGVAITDRANRLTCANSTFAGWFGQASAPPNLPLDRPALEVLTRCTREAWRDGHSAAAGLSDPKGRARWNVSAHRAGRGEDYLIWRFTEIAGDNTAARMGEQLRGNLGAMLTRAGIEAALVGPKGNVASASAGFAERSAGDAGATLAGQEFVTLLRSDEAGRVYFAREGRRGSPQVLVHVPLETTDDGRGKGPQDAPSLMLLIDAGVGVGGGWEGAGSGDGSGTAPQLESLLGALPLGLAMTDRDGRFLFANPPFLRAIGREEQGLPQFPSDLVVREDKTAMSDAVRRYGRGSANSGDMAVRLRDTPDDPVSLGLAGVRGLGEASVLLSLADSSEETKLRRQVVQASKMQSVGQLAGGIAHDFNNVLTAIIGYCDLMLLRHTPGDSDYDDIQQIRANSNRAASMTRQLLAFSRQQTLRPEVMQLPDVISEVSQLLKRLMGEKIEFSIRHDRDLGPVRADPQQLEQVIVNLAVNARDAILSSGVKAGKLTMATRRVSAKDLRKSGDDIIPVADYTVLILQDNGGGIPPENLGKIFEPFFTTKDQGKGTGLGLSTVYGIVKQSGGFIFADNVSRPDGSPEGARFTVYLPVHSGPVAAKATAPETTAASDWSGGGRVLLVEDEDMVRAVAERALTREGYSVTACADGEEGLAAVANAKDGGDEFDVVVSDVVMPVMDGPAMARAIRKVRPGLPFLFMSGYAEETLRDQIDIENMHFIPKPFSVAQIGQKVGEVLAASRVKA